VVDKPGNVYFTDTGNGVWMVDKKGNLTNVAVSKFHRMTIDALGYFAKSSKKFGEYFKKV